MPLAYRSLEETRPDHARSLDAAGSVSLTLALAALIFAMSSGEQRGFGASLTLGALGLSAILTIAFVVIERRAREPVVSFSFLNIPARRTAVIGLMMLGGALSAYAFMIALFLRGALGFSGSETSLVFIPGPVVFVTSSLLLTRRLLERLGPKIVALAGLVSLAAGQFWLSRLSADSSYLSGVFPGLLMTGLGVGLTLPTFAATITSGARPEERGLAGGLVPTAQQIGAAIGVAVLTTIAATTTASHGGDIATGFGRAFLISGIALAALMVLVALTPLRPSHR
ncbi:unannotated protein [freshwater metagenome]|uniref:Unannotated protein n=1 Tax=freshwater metagenome TaxID=449393 RepID=A0A6J7DH13_9ZZZZ